MPAAGFDFALDDQAIGDLVNFIQSINESVEAGTGRIAQNVPTAFERR